MMMIEMDWEQVMMMIEMDWEQEGGFGEQEGGFGEQGMQMQMMMQMMMTMMVPAHWWSWIGMGGRPPSRWPY